MRSQWMTDFRKDERGTASIESLFWIPLFIYLLVLITDVSLIFYGKAQALRIVQDGNRAYSVNQFANDTAAEAFILTRLQSYSPSSTVDTKVADGLITTEAVLKASELMSIGSIPGFSDKTIVVTAQHFKEQ